MLKDGRLEFRELENGTVVPVLNGSFFCSTRDPLKEAQKWFESVQSVCANQKEVVVIGLGAGFHVLLLLKMGLKVSVLEARPELVAAWPLKDKVQFVDWEHQTGSVVLEFRPAWSGEEAAYAEMSRRLRGVQVQALQDQAEAKGLWILSQALESSRIPDSIDVTIKDIVEALPRENQTEEARIWRALRELVS